MKLLSYFISGILFISFIFPLLESIATWFASWIELKKAKISEKINKINIRMEKEDDDNSPRQIGFCISNPELNEEEDEDDEV